MVGFAGRGYGASAFSSGARGAFQIRAAENFTNTAQGTYMSFWTTPKLSTTLTERMRIDNAGMVGIGTTTPTATLQVVGKTAFSYDATYTDSTSGSMFIQNATTPAKEIVMGYDTQAGIDAGFIQSLHAGTGLKNLLINPRGGNVGIGTTTPTNPLQVMGKNGGAVTDYAIKWANSGGGTLGYIGADASSYNSGAIHLYQNAVASTVISALGNSYLMGGNVGIGTTAPNSLLTLGGANNEEKVISLYQYGATGWPTVSKFIGITPANGGTYANSGFSGIEFGGAASAAEGYLAFHTHDNGVSSGERMRIDKSGNVGIGSASPANRLDVRLQNNAAGNAITFGSATYHMGIMGEDSSANAVWFGNNYGATAGDSYLDFRLANTTTGETDTTNANTAKMRLYNNGNASFGGTVSAPTFTGIIRLKGYTVTTLPTGTIGDTAYVTDALAPTFLATIVGGGAIVTPVFYNGTNWVGY
jgi:hypothetical protein